VSQFGPCIAPANGVEERKRFFLKKEAKTFVTAPTAWRTLHHPCAAQGTKVFWFFFFKKEPLP
jgi:hypothetical protein